MVTREQLHHLIDALPERGLAEAQRYLEALREAGGDPVLARLLLAPEDDEEDTPEEAAGAEEAWQEYQRGEAVSAEEAKRRVFVVLRVRPRGSAYRD